MQKQLQQIQEFYDGLPPLFKKIIRGLWNLLIRRWSIIRIAIRILLLSIISELAVSNFDVYQTKLILLIENDLNPQLAVIIGFILSFFVTGFSWWSIAIKGVLLIWFSLLEFMRDQQVSLIQMNFGRKKWHPSKSWFKKVNENLYSHDILSKYNPELHVDTQEIVDSIIDQVVDPINEIDLIDKDYDTFFSHYKEARAYLFEFNRSHLESKTYDSVRNKFRHFRLLRHYLITFKLFYEDWNNSVKNGHWYKLTQISEHEIFQKADKLEGISTEAFMAVDDSPILETSDEMHFRQRSFASSSLAISTFLGFQQAIKQLCKNYQFVHGDAGMGKTHTSAHIALTLVEKGYYVVFTQGKHFYENPADLDANFRKALKIASEDSFSEILEKLNTKAKSKRKRLLFIVDGLNETRYNVGFSNIWENHITEILHTIEKYQHLFFLFTLRTSYITRIWTDNPPSKLLQIRGFDSELVTKEAVKKYCNHYNLQITNLETANVSFFRNPLMLDLFCKMVSKESSETIILETTTYLKVFDDYINRLMLNVQRDLGKPHPSLMHEALTRSSKEFLKESKAELPLRKFYEAVDDVPWSQTDNSKSIAHRFLEGQLIFILDNLQPDNSDIVRHTQQQVGGYLLAKYVIALYPNASDITTSSEFADSLKGSVPDSETGKRNSSAHQLAYDILTFLVILYAQKGDHLLEHTDDQAVIDLSWQNLGRGDIAANKELLITTLDNHTNSRKGWAKLLDTTFDSLISTSEELNISFLHPRLMGLNPFLLDLTWGNFLYNNAIYLAEAFSSVGFGEIRTQESSAHLDLFNLLAMWSLETTVKTTRDQATLVLLQEGEELIEFIIPHLQQLAQTKHTYVYERLALIAYGVSLRNQHSEEFVQNKLSKLATIVFELQFSETPTAPSYNYIVIDSFKHLIDLAIENDVCELTEAQLDKPNKYQFTAPFEWPEISEEDRDLVDPIVRSWHTDVEPFRGDFVHYTIPRLTKGHEAAAEATVHIHKRLRDLGYEELAFNQSQNQTLKTFFQGSSIYGVEGKIDRLGKKYSWMAFFDYAGYLLNKGELNVWDKEEGEQRYTRLSDVGVDPSIPTSTQRNDKLFLTDLFEHRSNEKDWTDKPMYASAKGLVKYEDSDHEFSLIYGVVEKRDADSYDTRSFLLIEAFLLESDVLKDNFEKLRGREFDWHDDLNAHSSIYNVYYGELYWADNTVLAKPYHKDLPTGNKIKRDIPSDEVFERLTYDELIQLEQDENVSKEIDERFSMCVEQAYADYQWEGKSDVFPGLSITIPSTNIGKYFNLKGDPQSLTILDKEKARATLNFSYEKQIDNSIEEQKLGYLRSDLLKEYLTEKGYSLLYQIKQHTYDRTAGDGTGQFRGMQFFTPDSLLGLDHEST